jgi:hypothetical protein
LEHALPYVETFDGLEEAPAPTWTVCMRCGARVPFDLWVAMWGARSGWALREDEVAGYGLYRARERGFEVTLVAEGGPPAYVASLACPGCGAASPVVLGLMEFQPARWIGGVVRPDGVRG